MKRQVSPRAIAFLASTVFCVSVFAAGKKDAKPLEPISKPGVYQGYSEKDYKGFSYTSQYIPMRDSVLLAVDIFLPKHLEPGKKVPAILYLSRYVRSIQAKFPFNLIVDPVLGAVSDKEVSFFTSFGYACVIVDVRGTGASFGPRRMEFSPEEIADGKDVVDWMVKQPWCDGNIGTTGVSYLGTTAEMLLANQHPNVKACIPRSSIFDLYNDMIFPGGVCQGPFVDIWGHTTLALDHNDFSDYGKKGKLVRGIHPVKGDKHREMLLQAVELHKKNFDVSKGLGDIRYRDDVQASVNACLNDFSVHSRLKQIQASGTPIYRIDGWYDGGLAKGTLDASLNTSNTKKVLIGPWDHGPRNNVSPFAKTKDVGFDVKAEMLRFFDHYLKGVDNGIDKEPLYTYYTVGEESWKTSNVWPPKDEKPQVLFLSNDNSLVSARTNSRTGTLNYKVDYTTTTGLTTRWNSLTTLYMHGPSNYADRRTEDQKLLCFTSEKLNTPTEIAGHPIVNLQFSADASDATVFVYLEDVGPDSSVTYVTEGMFRPLDKKINDNATYQTPYPDHSYIKKDGEPYKAGETVALTFDLLPIAYQFQKDHRIRISIAGADAGHFNLPEPKPTQFNITTGGEKISFLELPVVNN